tara:strand:+ start:78 stop:650 length:573 start_codon:yes stop_codon:yes gene_type:complete
MSKIKGIFLVLAILISGCTTNQIHFSSYTDEGELKSLRDNQGVVSEIKIEIPAPCQRCGERGNFVWHAANYTGTNLYEGFFPIPMDNWNDFISEALGSTESTKSETIVNLERVFLKTWPNPEYYAANVNLVVTKNSISQKGEALIKIRGQGQKLLSVDRVVLDDNSKKAIALAIKAAYLDAYNKLQPSKS